MLPLSIVIAFYCAVSVAYTSSVDLAWLIDQQLQQAQNLTDAQREQAVKAALRISAGGYRSDWRNRRWQSSFRSCSR